MIINSIPQPHEEIASSPWLKGCFQCGDRPRLETVTGHQRCRFIGGRRLSVTPQGVCERPERHEDGHDGRKPPLEPSRRAHTDQRPHEKAQVEATRVDQQSFEDVVVAAQMGVVA